jgi:hypothetical protein
MFNIKRKDGYNAHFTAYAFRDLGKAKYGDLSMQFLIWDSKHEGNWHWVFAKDWVPEDFVPIKRNILGYISDFFKTKLTAVLSLLAIIVVLSGIIFS